MHDNFIVNTSTTIALQLDELPTITPGAIMRGSGAGPDGAGAGTAGARSGGEIPLVLARRIFHEDVSEEGLEEGRTATDETGVDFDDASGTHVVSVGRKEGSKGKKLTLGEKSSRPTRAYRAC